MPEGFLAHSIILVKLHCLNSEYRGILFSEDKGSDIDETSLFHMRARSLHKLFLDLAIYLPETLGDRIQI